MSKRGQNYTLDALRASGQIVSDVGVKIDELAPVMPERLTEAKFQALVMGFAKAHGWLPWHCYDARKSEEGFPDILAVKPGRILVAELKVGNNRPTKAQEQWLERFRAAGAETFLWRPSDWATIKAVLAGGGA